MEYEALKHHLYDYNEDELFYKSYYFARQQQYSLEKFLAQLDMRDVLRRKLIVIERPETIPPRFEDSFFFDLSDDRSIVVQKHNRYSPPILHSHTFFELLYVYDGSVQQTVSGVSVNLHSGDFCVIPPDIEHSLGVFDDSIIINIMLRYDTISKLFPSFMYSDNPLSSFFYNHVYAKRANDYIIVHTGTDQRLSEAMLRTYWENLNKELYYYECIRSTIETCFFIMMRDYRDSVSMPQFAQKIDVQRYALIRFIEENYREITLSDVAEKFHYTPEYTSRIIKAATGMTYSQIIRRVRMEEAKSLLAHTNINISTIAEQVGYDTPEHFIRQFKKEYNLTPTAYRRSI